MTPETPSFRKAVPALLLLTGVFFVNFLARTVLGPLLLPTSERLGVRLAIAAQAFVALSVGYSVAVFGAGFLSSRIGHHRTICLCLFLLGMSLLGLSMTTTLGGLLGWVLLLGLGAGLYMPSGVTTITTVTPQSGWSRAFALHEMAPNLSFVLAPFVVEVASHFGAAIMTFAWIGWASLAMGVLYAWRGPRIERLGVAPRLSALRPLLRNSCFWAVVVLFVITVGVEVGVYSVVPAYLVHDRGLSEADANMFLGSSRVVSLAVLPWMGWITERLGLVRTLTVCMLGVGLTTCVAGAGPLPVSLALLTLQPFLAVCFFPVGFAILAQVVRKEEGDLSVSLAVTCTSLLGSGLLPAILAAWGEQAGFAWAFFGFGVASLLASSCALRHLWRCEDRTRTVGQL